MSWQIDLVTALRAVSTSAHFLASETHGDQCIDWLWDFWAAHDKARAEFDEIPPSALRDLRELSGKNWRVQARRILNDLAMPIVNTQPRLWGYPGSAVIGSPDSSIQEAGRLRMLEELRPAVSSGWPVPYAAELEELTRYLLAIVGERYEAATPTSDDRSGQDLARIPEASPTVAGGDLDGDKQPPDADHRQDVDTGDGWTWQAVRDELERLRLKGESYTSQRKMAERIGCTPFLVGKAIKSGSVELEEWAWKPEGQSRLNAAPEVSAMTFDRTPQQREDDPTSILEQADVDAALAYVIDQAGPEERARIHAMTPAEQRQLAEVAYRDPDKEEQAKRYRRNNRKRGTDR